MAYHAEIRLQEAAKIDSLIKYYLNRVYEIHTACMALFMIELCVALLCCLRKKFARQKVVYYDDETASNSVAYSTDDS